MPAVARREPHLIPVTLHLGAGSGDEVHGLAPECTRDFLGPMEVDTAGGCTAAWSRCAGAGASCVRRTRASPDTAVTRANETTVRAVAVFVGRAV